MSTLKEIIGRNIRDIREQVGFTRFELGERVNLSETALGLIERGVSWPKYENLLAIARALGCDERAFVSFEPIKRPGIPRDLLARLAEATDDEIEALRRVLGDVTKR